MALDINSKHLVCKQTKVLYITLFDEEKCKHIYEQMSQEINERSESCLQVILRNNISIDVGNDDITITDNDSPVFIATNFTNDADYIYCDIYANENDLNWFNDKQINNVMIFKLMYKINYRPSIFSGTAKIHPDRIAKKEATALLVSLTVLPMTKQQNELEYI